MSDETSMPVWHDERVRRGMEAQWAGLGEAGAVVGWKLGVGTQAAMEVAGTTGPLLGYLTAATRIEAGAQIRVEGWTKPVVEPEIAIYVGADVAAGAGREEAAAAISALGLAFEVVDIDLTLDQVEAALAGDIFHRHYMLGAPVEARAGGRADGLDLRLLRGDEQVAGTDAPEATVGDFVELVRHAADYLDAFGRRLAAGQFIISGSVTPPIPLAVGDSLSYLGADLGELTLNVV